MEDSKNIFLRTGIKLLSAGESSPALSLRTVAKKAGYSHNALYRHFATKDIYLDALTAYGFSQLSAQFEICTSKEEVLRAYYEFATKKPELYELMFLTVKTETQMLRKKSGLQTLDLFITKLGLSTKRPSSHATGVATWIALHGYIMIEKSGMLPRDRIGNKLLNYSDFIKTLP